MNGEASARVRRISDAGRPEAAASPRVVSVFRRHDDTICHGRCERPLVLKGVRAMLEADFYCFTCLIHVTLPLVVLDTLPIVRTAPSKTS